MSWLWSQFTGPSYFVGTVENVVHHMQESREGYGLS